MSNFLRTLQKEFNSPMLRNLIIRMKKPDLVIIRVKLKKTGILAELTSTYRTGFHQYTFPESESSHILIDLKHRDMVLRIIDQSSKRLNH